MLIVSLSVAGTVDDDPFFDGVPTDNGDHTIAVVLAVAGISAIVDITAVAASTAVAGVTAFVGVPAIEYFVCLTKGNRRY
jgi:hypothetical protein